MGRSSITLDRLTGRAARALDPRAIHLLEGLRAGAAASAPVLAGYYMAPPGWNVAALAALLTCLADPGGTLSRRVLALGGFAVAGAALMLLIPAVHGLGLVPLLAVAVPLLFALSMARVWGAGAQGLGDLLAVTLLLAADKPVPMGLSWVGAAAFLAGGLFATALTLVIWRLAPHAPARRAVGDAYASLAEYARELAALAEPAAAGSRRSWGGRAAVRDAFETAREVLDAATGPSGPAAELARCLMALEAGEQIFAALIALSDRLEDPGPITRAAAAKSLRRLRPLLRVLAAAIERDRLDRLPRFERAIAQATSDAAACTAIAPIAAAIAERLRLAAASSDPRLRQLGTGAAGEALPLRARVLDPLRANLSGQSAILRHAARISLVAGGMLAFTLGSGLPNGHWLTITLVLVMQPYFAHTFGRSMARMGGTIAGGLIAAVISLAAHGYGFAAGFLPLLGALSLAVRRVNYSLYVAVYTPVVILLTEQMAVHANPLLVARERALLTMAGGVIAIIANAVIWPFWEVDQAEQALTRAIGAHAKFAGAVFARRDAAVLRDAGREAGLAANNLEAAIERLAREPGTTAARLRHLRLADGTLRRIGGRLVAWSLDPAPLNNAVHCAQAKWVQAALEDLAAARMPPQRPGGTAAHETLARMARQVEVLATVLRPREAV